MHNVLVTIYRKKNAVHEQGKKRKEKKDTVQIFIILSHYDMQHKGR